MDKLAFGGADARRRRPVAQARPCCRGRTPPSFDGPYIVKPRFGGSSIGIEVVEDWETAVALLATSPTCVRARSSSRTVPTSSTSTSRSAPRPTLAVSDVEKPAARAPRRDLYSYAEKYLRPTASPPHRASSRPTSPELRRHACQHLAVRVVELTGLTGILRIDFLSDGTGEALRQRGQLDPGALSLYLWPDTPPSEVLVPRSTRPSGPVPRRPATTRWVSPSAPPAASPASWPACRNSADLLAGASRLVSARRAAARLPCGLRHTLRADGSTIDDVPRSLLERFSQTRSDRRTGTRRLRRAGRR